MASFSALNTLLCVMGAGSEHCLTATSKQHGVPPLPPQPVWGKAADEAGTGCGARSAAILGSPREGCRLRAGDPAPVLGAQEG